MLNTRFGVQPPGRLPTAVAPASNTTPGPEGRKPPVVLIVEDQLMIADITEEFLGSHGYQVCGIARTVEEAVALGLHHKPDIVVLDLRLADGGLGTEIPARLASLTKLGILYVTGNISAGALTSNNGHACLNKPYRFVDLMRGLEIVAEVVETGLAPPPFPRGFRLLQPAAA